VSALHVRVRGRVQGVGFRWFVAERARSLGVSGWVRNTEDRCVEVVASGPEQALIELRRALEQGPAAARVIGLEELAPAEDVSGDFRVLR